MYGCCPTVNFRLGTTILPHIMADKPTEETEVAVTDEWKEGPHKVIERTSGPGEDVG